MKQQLSRSLPARTMALCLIALLLFLFPLAPGGFGQQTNVTQFDLYAGYALLDTPNIGLFENGFQTQFGYRVFPWVSLGFDYSVSRGTMTLTPGLLATNLQNSLGATLTGLAALGQLPPGYTLTVPADSTTHTLALGPQLAYRHFSKVTLFLRPSIGAIHESATPKPADPIATAITAQLVPSGTKTDWTIFYGFGYGFDILFTPHLAWRVQGDLVWNHLFNDMLLYGRYGRMTTRFSTGPCFNFGKNIVGK